MADATIDETKDLSALYQWSLKLQEAVSKNAADKHEKLYTQIIESVKKPGSKTKQLAAQFIPKYFKHFPKQSDAAINAQLDLCEDEMFAVRVDAIKGLPELCKDTPEHLPKIADFLGQLLMTEDSLEANHVKRGLQKLVQQDMKETFGALFNLMIGNDENMRDRAIHYVKEKILALNEDALKKDTAAQRHIADQIKKVLVDVTGNEFVTFMEILTSLSTFKDDKSTVPELIDIITEQAFLDTDFNPTEVVESVDRLQACLNWVVPLYPKGGSPSKFATYLATQVLPKHDKLTEPQLLQFLKAVAEMSPYTMGNDCRALLPPLYAIMREHIPVKPAGKEEPKINFSIVECLLYAFHQLAAKVPGFMNGLCGLRVVTGQPSDMANASPEKLADFVGRMKYLLQRTEHYVVQLNETTKKLTQEKPPTTEDDKKALAAKKEQLSTALKTTTNIKQLVQPLIRGSPSFLGGKSAPSLSLSKSSESEKKAVAQKGPAAGVKRGAEADKGAEAQKRLKSGQPVYVPPSRQGQGKGGPTTQIRVERTGRFGSPAAGQAANGAGGAATGRRGRGKRSWGNRR